MLHTQPPQTAALPSELEFTAPTASIGRRQHVDDDVAEGADDELVCVSRVQTQKTQEKLMKILQVTSTFIIVIIIPRVDHLLHGPPEIHVRVHRVLPNLDSVERWRYSGGGDGGF